MQTETVYIVGTYFAGTRKDGRFFKGRIEKVSSTSKGSLLVIRTGEQEYKSIYANDITYSDCRSYQF
jgi:hypothetical protein